MSATLGAAHTVGELVQGVGRPQIVGARIAPARTAARVRPLVRTGPGPARRGARAGAGGAPPGVDASLRVA